MSCPRCGAETRETNPFCVSCGASLRIYCSACGRAAMIGAEVCAGCGTALNATAASAGGSQDLSQRLFSSLRARGAERKRLTVLAADICNSTGLIGAMDPEAGIRRLQPAIDCMSAAVDRFDGVVNRTMGDGIMAVFGAPKPREDHAMRACLAALAMQDAVRRLGDPDLKIRVGVHTGEVVVQAINNTLYHTYDASGATVHLANRLEQMAEDGGILLSRDTYVAARQFVKTQSLGARPVRGFAQPMETYRLTGVRHAPASELFRNRPRLTPMVGRETPFGLLEAALGQAIAGKGRVVAVVGEAGVGKSRLCFEFVEQCRRLGVRVYESRVLGYGSATPLQPILSLLREYFGISDSQNADEARTRVTQALDWIGITGDDVDLVLDFLGLSAPGATPRDVDPALRKLRQTELIRRIAQSPSAARATVVLIEDLHWIDAASAEFVAALAGAVADSNTMLLLNFRPGFVAPWMQHAHFMQVGLQPLDAAQSNEVLRDLAGRDASLLWLSREIVERSRGNPFFMEELVYSLAERGDLEGTQGSYRFAGELGALPLPATVEAVLSARIDRLDDPARQLLQTAAVIGREVPLPILERVRADDPAALLPLLQRLEDAELLYRLLRGQEILYAFRHPLIEEVAYRSLLQERRTQLHGAVAQAVEAVFKERPGERAGLLAYHLERAGEMLKAAQASMRAAIWVGAHDAREAFGSWKKVLELLADQPASPLVSNLKMMACGQAMNFGWREGLASEAAEGYFEEGKRLALATGNLRGNALIHAAYGRILAATGSADEYVEKIREALAFPGTADDASLQVTLTAMLCQALRLAGRTEEALALNTEAMPRAREIGERDRKMLGFDVEHWLSSMRGQLLVTLGRFDEARSHLDQLLDGASAQSDLTGHMAHVTYVDLACARGEVGLAERHAARALRLADESGSPYVRVYAQASRGLAHTLAGRFDDAIDDLGEALSFARERRAGLEIEARILADLANAHHLRGELDDAWRIATEAIDVARRRCARVPECLAHAVRASVLAAHEDRDGAAAALERAQALLQETGAAIYEPFIRAQRERARGAKVSQPVTQFTPDLGPCPTV